MIKLRHFSVHVCFCMFLLATIAFAKTDSFVPNDPPPRQESTVVYEKADLSEMRLVEPTLAETQTPQASNIPKQISSAVTSGRQLLGAVTLLLRENFLPDASKMTATIYVYDSASGEERQIAEAPFLETGRLEVQFPGTYATEIRVRLTSETESNPLESIQAQTIVLSSEPRIMLMGDSITRGKFASDSIGYRKVLYDQLQMKGYNVDFVGGYGEEPYEGHYNGGMKINDFYPQGMTLYAKGRMDVTYPMDTFRPNLVAVHLGTNDLYSETGMPISPYGEGSTFAHTQAGEMATLINYLLQWHNGSRGTELEHIVVSLIIPIKYQDSVCVEFNSEVARLVNDFRSGAITGRPEPVYLTDHFSRFREWPALVANGYKALMEDTLHPNTAGHNLMGETYFTDISHILFKRTPWFRDVTWYVGVAGYDHYFENQGIAIADVNADGRDDIYMSRTNSDVPNAHESLYIAGDLPFDDKTIDFNVADNGGSRGTVFFDMDSDGDLDLFNGNSGAGNRLYENLNAIEFRDVTASAGIASLSRVTTGVLAFDADNDGDMDLYAVNSREPNELYINNGSGQFTMSDRGANDLDEPNIPSLSVSATDVDLDGDTDLYICKRDAPNVLFVNDGNGYFSEAAAAAGIALQANSNGAVWSDLDRDGDPDLLVAVTSISPGVSENMAIYENRGDGTFINRTSSAITVDGYSPIVADFDNDGDDDILLTLEGGYAAMYRNNGNWSFTKLQDTGAEIHGGDIRGASLMDLQDDGDIDILTARADMLNVFLENNLDNGNTFVKIHVKGPGGNAIGFGSKIWLFEAGRLNDMSALLSYKQVVSSTGHISQNSPTLHFGLAHRAICDVLVQFTDGTLVAKRNVAANQTLFISPEFQSSAEPALLSYIQGDGQQGTVGENLPNPLEVQVTDAEGIAVPDALVIFQIISGDAQLFLPNYSSEQISIETEAGQLNGSARWVYDETCSNQGCVLIPPTLSANGTIILQKEIASPGDYFAWLRLENVGEAQNVSMQVDELEPLSLSVPATSQWEWVKFQTFVHLSSDLHTFNINLTSHDIHIDKLLLTANPNYVPSGLEDTNSDPELTDSQGIARRYVQLNQIAGDITVEANLQQNGELLPNSPIVYNLTANPGPAVSMQETSGNNQQGEAGVSLEPFVVTVHDAFDNPVPNRSVTFTVVSGGGTLTTDNIVLTDSKGQAQTTLVPGESASQQQVRAESENLTGSPVTFTAYITGAAKEMQLVSGSGQNGTVMSILPQPVKVRVLGENDSPAIGYSVQFHTNEKAGRVSASTFFANADSVVMVQTDEQGYASAYWQLGRTAGKQRLFVSAGSLVGSPQTISAQASPASPALLLKISGDEQQGTVNTSLQNPFHVRVMDNYGNANPGVPVTFQSLISEGSFSGLSQKSVTTDSTGDARTVYTLGGMAGAFKVAQALVVVNGDTLPGSPADFYATALADKADISQVIGQQEFAGTVNTDLSQPFSVKITDAHNNPVSNFSVTFQVLQGDGNLNGSSQQDVLTNANGIASVLYRIGRTSGEQVVRALCPGTTPEYHDFAIQALPSTPHQLIYISGNGQKGAIHSALPDSFVVSIRDEFDNGVPLHPVQFEMTSQAGSFAGKRTFTAISDANGDAKALMTLGAEMGDSLYTAKASSEYDGQFLFGSPILFHAGAIKSQPSAIQAITSTNNLSAPPFTELAEPVTVKIVDADFKPVSGFPVEFQILRGGGYFAENDTANMVRITDENGRASARWVLGEPNTTQQMAAIAKHDGKQLQHSPILFNATTVEAQVSRLREISGNYQKALPNSELAEPFVVRVLDTAGQPVPNHSVVFSIHSGGGRFVSTSANLVMKSTDELGHASVRFKLGSTMGENAHVVQAQSFNESGVELKNSPLTFYATAVTRRLTIVSGDSQRAVVTQTLPLPLKVRASDNLDEGVEGLDVEFIKLQGDGQFTSSSQVLTEQDGTASVCYKFGEKSNVERIRARIEAIDQYVDFTLYALADEPVRMRIAGGNLQTGVAGHKLNQRLNVQTLDQYENGVPELVIHFEPQPQHGQVNPSDMVITDSLGVASVEWTLGFVIGDQFLFAKNDRLGSTLQFKASALPNQPPQISVADSFVIQEDKELSFMIIATDAENDSILLSVSNLPENAIFENGEFQWRPEYDQAGDYFVLFQASDSFGARSVKVVKISVENVNRPPHISLLDSRPLSRDLTLKMPGAIDFFVAATDPDAETLNYLWRVDGQPKSTSSTFRLQSQLFGAGVTLVEALVSDRHDTVGTSWSLHIITAIELSSFSATYQEYTGVELNWQTRYEWGNQGFYVERSTSRNGPFEPVAAMIPANSKGEYQHTDMSIEPGMLYFYRLSDIQKDGKRTAHEVIQFKPPLPTEFKLYPNYPNPFNPTTTLNFDIPRVSHVTFLIYDVLGRHVNTLFDEELKPGFHKITWNGRNEQNQRVASGIYYAVLVTEDERFVTKMVLLR